MAGATPLRYDATGHEIRPGDFVSITIEGRHVLGLVRHASLTSRRVEVWVPKSAVRNHQARRRSCSRKDVVPVPGMARKTWPPKLIPKLPPSKLWRTNRVAA